MFDDLAEPRPDAILALMARFRADERDDKLDLGVGVYKDRAGATPVMRAVREAERRLLDEQVTKGYVSPIGSRDFAGRMVRQVFGDGIDATRIGCAQSVGGSGALRVLADLMHEARPGARIHVSDPTWPNHLPLLGAAGFEVSSYPYLDASGHRVDVDAMCAALEGATQGDIVVLHGCCHNPTGADPDAAGWRRVLDAVKARRLFPLIDLAYQGFGDGPEEDASMVRLFAGELDELAVAASCSKNFGLYRERVGAAMLLARNASDAGRALGRLGGHVRSNYSMPPDHGANVTGIILGDEALRADWRAELESMRLRMVDLREAFAEALRKRSNSDRFDYLTRQKGMFGRLPLDTAQIETLRERHGIYIVGDGRINVAGLPDDPGRLEAVADAIVTVVSAGD